jgi:hypothetical protein
MYWCTTWQVIWHTLWKPEGNLLFGRRHRWEDGTKMDLKEIEWEVGVFWPWY